MTIIDLHYQCKGSIWPSIAFHTDQVVNVPGLGCIGQCFELAKLTHCIPVHSFIIIFNLLSSHVIRGFHRLHSQPYVFQLYFHSQCPLWQSYEHFIHMYFRAWFFNQWLPCNSSEPEVKRQETDRGERYILSSVTCCVTLCGSCNLRLCLSGTGE